jgi:gamma-glutamyl-gamma-aminobutyrate hydrolase PuuD
MRKLALVRFAVRIGPRPRIGVTADPGYDVGEYEAAIRQAGGEPVRWMPDVTRIDADLRNVDGIILSGGEDIDPARYGQALHPQAELASAARDEYEIALARAAYGRGIPTLAICRGLQIANVAFGGSLHQHLPDAFGADVPHAPQVDGATYRGLIDEHRVAVAEGSLLAKIAGDAVVTGSRHHQAVDRVADALRVVGRAPDGVVEALEAPAAKAFWLAVQWHPESTTALDAGASAALFAALVASARPYTDRSSG